MKIAIVGDYRPHNETHRAVSDGLTMAGAEVEWVPSNGVPMLARMFEKRLRGYRAICYASEEAPLASAQPCEEPTVKYDEDAFPDFDGTP